MNASRISMQAALLTCALLVVPVAGWTQSSTEVAKSTGTATATTDTATKKAEEKVDNRNVVEKAVDKVKAVVKEKAEKFEIRTPSGGGAVRG